MGRQAQKLDRGKTGLAPWTLAVVVLLLLPCAAEANYVYWTNQDGTTIGRAKLNGEGVNDNFITGLAQPRGIATDAKHIYWMQGDAAAASIGRANLDGSGVEPGFIPHQAEMEAGGGIAITPTNGIYWANRTDTIGHASLDGSDADPAFITGPSGAICGLATDERFVYWLNAGPSGLNRAALDGSGQIADFVPGTAGSCGLGVYRGYIYYGAESGRVGRVDASGGLPAEPDFITGGSGADPLCGMGVTNQFLFWGNPGNTEIGRAGLYGKNVRPNMIDGPSDPCMVTAAPPNKITVTEVRLNQKKGIAWIDAKVPAPGRVELTTEPLGATASRTLAPVTLTLPNAGPFDLLITAQGTARKRLDRKGRAWVTAYLNFTPEGVNGVTQSERHSVRLVKKLKRNKKQSKRRRE